MNTFSPAFAGNGVFLFVLEGEATSTEEIRKARRLGISATASSRSSRPGSELLAIEVRCSLKRHRRFGRRPINQKSIA